MSREIQIQLPKPHQGQRKVLDEARRFNVLECGRRFGKSTIAMNLAVETALSGRPAAWFAPTYKAQLDQWREVERLIAPVLSSSNRTDGQMRLVTGGVIDFWSLDNPDSGRGRKYARVVIDEASVIRDLQEAWQGTIRPTLTDYKGDAWFLGTPKGRNFFHQLFVRGEHGDDPEWRSWRLGTSSNPYMDPSEVEGARRDLPEHIYRQEYEGVPADDGGNPFGLDAIRECVMDEPTGRPVVVWGIDLAKSVDWTVAIGLDEEGRVSRVDRWQGSWLQTKQRILAQVDTFALVDSTGVGDPVLEDLQREASHFEGFKFSAQSKQQIMEGLAVAIQQRSIRIPAGVIVSELESFEYEYTRTGTRYGAPSGLHDDCVCALALAWAEFKSRSGGVGIRPSGIASSSYWRS